MLHIDGDLIVHRIAIACGDDAEESVVGYTCNSFMTKEILMAFDECTPYKVYLSGTTNFRDAIGVTAPYKGNRWGDERRAEESRKRCWTGWLADTAHKPTKPRPKHLEFMRQHLVDVWGAEIFEGIEADDAIATAATEEQAEGGIAVIVSLDKDFYQVPDVQIHNFVTKKTQVFSAMAAMKNLYKQVLCGDSVDNIIGLEDCGPVLASTLIDGCTKELDMFLICVDQLGKNRFIENMHLVYLRRKENTSFFNATTYKLRMEAARESL